MKRFLVLLLSTLFLTAAVAMAEEGYAKTDKNIGGPDSVFYSDDNMAPVNGMVKLYDPSKDGQANQQNGQWSLQHPEDGQMGQNQQPGTVGQFFALLGEFFQWLQQAWNDFINGQAGNTDTGGTADPGTTTPDANNPGGAVETTPTGDGNGGAVETTPGTGAPETTTPHHRRHHGGDHQGQDGWLPRPVDGAQGHSGRFGFVGGVVNQFFQWLQQAWNSFLGQGSNPGGATAPGTGDSNGTQDRGTLLGTGTGNHQDHHDGWRQERHEQRAFMREFMREFRQWFREAWNSFRNGQTGTTPVTPA